LIVRGVKPLLFWGFEMFVPYKRTINDKKGKEKVIEESKMYYGNHKDYKLLEDLAITNNTKMFWVSLSGVN